MSRSTPGEQIAGWYSTLDCSCVKRGPDSAFLRPSCGLATIRWRAFQRKKGEQLGKLEKERGDFKAPGENSRAVVSC